MSVCMNIYHMYLQVFWLHKTDLCEGQSKSCEWISLIHQLIEIIIINYTYIAIFCFFQALYIVRGYLLIHHQCAASTWMMWRQPYCSRTPTAHQLTGGEDTEWCSQSVDIGIVRRPWRSEANGQNWPGWRGHTSTLFKRHPGIFNDHRESGPRFNVSSEGRCFLQCPHHYTGALGPTQTVWWAPHSGLTNTSSSSNLVFWPAQPCLASVGNLSWAAGWYGCRPNGLYIAISWFTENNQL